MSFAERHNKKNFNIPFDTSNFDFIKCRELDSSHVYRVYGYFSSVGMYGKQYSLILEHAFLNLPKHMTDTMDALTANDDADIIAGKVGIKKRSYTSKNGKDCASVEWVDM